MMNELFVLIDTEGYDLVVSHDGTASYERAGTLDKSDQAERAVV